MIPSAVDESYLPTDCASSFWLASHDVFGCLPQLLVSTAVVFVWSGAYFAVEGYSLTLVRIRTAACRFRHDVLWNFI